MSLTSFRLFQTIPQESVLQVSTPQNPRRYNLSAVVTDLLPFQKSLFQVWQPSSQGMVVSYPRLLCIYSSIVTFKDSFPRLKEANVEIFPIWQVTGYIFGDRILPKNSKMAVFTEVLNIITSFQFALRPSNYRLLLIPPSLQANITSSKQSTNFMKVVPG